MSYVNQRHRNQQEDVEDKDEEINELLQSSPSVKNEDEDNGNHDDIDDYNCNLKKYTKRKRIRNGIISCDILIIAISIPMLILLLASIKIFNHHSYSNDDFTLSNRFPNELLAITKNQIKKGEGVYSLSDFQNDISIIPYWEDVLSTYKVPIEASLYVIDDDDSNKKNETFNDELYGSFFASQSNDDDNETENKNDKNIPDDNEDRLQEHVIPHIGPCYLPLLQQDMDSIDWQSLINKNYNSPHTKRNITYPLPYTLDKHRSTWYEWYGEEQTNLENYCRPGFIIIGAGKCGTSSLYHYLVGHNRVVPSKQKQIHYFKYFTNRPMSWYLSHFYSAEDFLSSGALMTGEASPGYLPYPDVAHRIQHYMTTKAGNGYNQPVTIPKIITIVRNPLDRSYSSYKYNYIQPNLAKVKHDVNLSLKRLKRGFHNGPHHHQKRILRHSTAMIQNIISKNMTDEEILDEYFFSFEQLVEAELKVLEECLQSGGIGELDAKRLYGSKTWAKPLFDKRNNSTDLPPLVTLDESCYGNPISPTVPRRQWESLVNSYPNKLINVENIHLVQSLVGRSLYSLPLEWWYELYPHRDLLLVCNEDLKNHPSKTMSEVAEFLGLPFFNFDAVVDQGLYNVGGNEGYDHVTTWENVNNGNKVPVGSQSDDGIPISDELRKVYLSFVKPYNERLFDLTETKCKW